MKLCITVYDAIIIKFLEWSSELTLRPVQSFAGTSGPATAITSDPLQLFSLFFDNEVVDLIVKEKNQYAALCRRDNLWSTNQDELRAYFGFNVLMGINRLPEIWDYWSRDPRLHYSPISERITRDRYEEI